MAARDPAYVAKAPPQLHCGWCGELLPPFQAGLHEQCAREKAYNHVAVCKMCGSRDTVQNGDCLSYFHAVNRVNKDLTLKKIEKPKRRKEKKR